MRLQSLHLWQFRNYTELALELGQQNVHLFIGPNGSGKTNILEAISILSLSKSFLSVDEEDVRQWGADFYRVRTAAQPDAAEPKQLEVVSQMEPKKQKAFFINDVRVQAGELIGQLPTVIFLPQDLQLFTGPPAERRRFLDQLLCQVDPAYFRVLTDYQKVLKQRNALLRSIASGYASQADLAPWDQKLAETGSLVTLRRLELIETWNLTIADEVRSLGEMWNDVQVDYVRPTQARGLQELQTETVRLLQEGLQKDLVLQSTSVGPHREDWQVLAEGRALSTFASRGQQRATVLALLFLEASYVELRTNDRPVILLDDVFSELDDLHQARVLTSFADHQVLITGVQVPQGVGDAALWSVEAGQVMRRPL
jgi:DNA replication and repair protein RecF